MVEVTRQSKEPSANTNLASLIIEGKSLSPFSTNITSYASRVIGETVNVSGVAEHPLASVNIDGKGAQTQVSLASNGQIMRVVVTAENGATKEYDITYVLEKPAVHGLLKSLTIAPAVLTPAFSEATRNYTAAVAYETTQINIDAQAKLSTDLITINGSPVALPYNKSLTVGLNTITLKKEPIYVIVIVKHKQFGPEPEFDGIVSM